MPYRLKEISFSLEKIQSLIASIPVFEHLSHDELRYLSTLAYGLQYAPNEILVSEDAIVDSVLIIIEGQAEVSHSFIKKNKITHKAKEIRVPLAILHSNDTIGLNDTGFFSTTGRRTATVTAMSGVTALVIGLKELHEFLEHNPHVLPAMHDMASKMLKARLIKQSLPFNHLSHERIKWLAEKIQTIKFPAGKTIFSQGDAGNCCYLIASGEVEILARNEDNTSHRLAILKSPTLFGEATLITHSPRNAAALALTDCELLMLDHDHFFELIESEDNVAETFMTLMVDRSRPMQNPAITSHERLSADRQQIVILKNSATGSYFKLSKEGWFIWQQLNGKQSMQEITLALAKKFSLFSPEIVAALISRLARAGFVTQVELNETSRHAKQPLWIRMMLKLRRILEARIAFGDADLFITKIYNKAGRYIFTKLGKVIVFLTSIMGIISFGASTTNIMSTFQILPNAWLLLFLLIPATILTVIIHEFGHAFAVKVFGMEVHYMGVGWYWLGPIAFTDTSDMWLSTRWPRIMVNLAGIFSDITSASIVSLLLLLVSNPYIQAFLWLYALFTYINALRMMSPLQEWDGYYILIDLLDRPRLRQSAVLWLRSPKRFKKHIPEICYWLYCIVFLILVSLLTLLIQKFVFKILNLHSNALISLTLPILVVIISSLGVLADLRKSSE